MPKKECPVTENCCNFVDFVPSPFPIFSPSATRQGGVGVRCGRVCVCVWKWGRGGKKQSGEGGDASYKLRWQESARGSGPSAQGTCVLCEKPRASCSPPSLLRIATATQNGPAAARRASVISGKGKYLFFLSTRQHRGSSGIEAVVWDSITFYGIDPE